jgi:hypothetical protein
MNLAAFLNRMIGANYFDLLRRWHRFEIDGDGEKTLMSVGPAMIFANHGRATPAHLYMLKVLLAYEYGEPAYMIAPDVWFSVAYLRDAVEVAGFIPFDLEHAQRVADRGLKLIVSPGRHRESWGGLRDRYQIRWTGSSSDPQTTKDGIEYVRWAIECNLPILPLAATGVDQSYFAPFDSFGLWSRIKPGLAARFPDYIDLLDAPRRLALPPTPWIGLGPLGPWPFTPPLPVRIKHYVGAPIRIAEMRKLAGVAPDQPIETDDQREAILREVEKRVQEMLDHAADAPTERLEAGADP